MALHLLCVPLIAAFVGHLSGRYARSCLCGATVLLALVAANVAFLAWAFGGPGRSGATLLATFALVMVNAPLLVGAVSGLLTPHGPTSEIPAPRGPRPRVPVPRAKAIPVR